MPMQELLPLTKRRDNGAVAKNNLFFIDILG